LGAAINGYFIEDAYRAPSPLNGERAGVRGEWDTDAARETAGRIRPSCINVNHPYED
jgi:hypothetical protein